MRVLDFSLLFALACLVWWGSTGLILLLTGRPERTYRWSMLGATVLAAVALVAIIISARIETVESVIVAFVATIALWGAIEMAFLMGFVVGLPPTSGPQHRAGWPRFKAATLSILHHEVALAATLVLLIYLLRGEPNAHALHLFALLWAMRLSAKLNIYLGVSNANLEYLPRRIAHLGRHFRLAPMNALFPVSVTAATALLVVFVVQAFRLEVPPHEAASYALLATFTALALIEHWLLVLPLRSLALWPWARPTGQELTTINSNAHGTTAMAAKS